MKNIPEWTLSYNNREELLRLPVNPYSFVDAEGHHAEVPTNFEKGELMIIGRRKLRSMSLEFLYPAQIYTFCSYQNFPDPYDAKKLIEKWKRSNRPIRLIVTGTDINVAYAITNFEVETRDGTGDLYFHLDLMEYRFLNVSEIANEKASIDEATGLKDRASMKKETYKTFQYTTVEGDTPRKLAGEFLDDMINADILLRANNLDPLTERFEPGTTITIPGGGVKRD